VLVYLRDERVTLVNVGISLSDVTVQLSELIEQFSDVTYLFCIHRTYFDTVLFSSVQKLPWGLFTFRSKG
jgi:hypothetical protein